MTIIITILGYIAALFVSVAYLPQTIKIIKLKKADEFSLLFISLLIFGLLLFVIYGYFISAIPLIIESTISIALLMPIIYYNKKKGTKTK